MRILHILQSMDPELGGVCQAVRTIVKGLSDLGSTNEIACLDTPTVPFLSKEPTKIYALGESKNAWSYSRLLGPWLAEHLKDYDVAILHGLWQYHGFGLTKFMSNQSSPPRVGPRIFVMPHGMLDPYFQKAEGRKIKAIRNWIYWNLIEKNLINKASGVIYTCQTERILSGGTFPFYNPNRELIASLGVERPPLHAMEMTAAIAKKLPFPPSEKYILFLSRIQEKKGVDLLLQAYANVLKTHTGSRLPKIVVAGPGLETEYGQRMRQFVEESAELRSSVVFTGMLQGDAKWGAFYACEAFILPSHQENFGIAVVEALACKKPVLISNQVNIWREIAEAGAGIVDDNTLSGTERLLQQWFSMPLPDQTEMAQHALDLYNTRYTVKAASENLYSIIK